MKTGQIKYCWRVSGLVASSLLGAVVGCTDADQTGLYEPNPDWSNLQKHENTAVVGSEGAIIVAGEAAITIPSGAQVVRFLPALNLSRADAEEALDLFESVVKTLA